MSQRRRSMYDILPPDVLTAIFIGLPIKTLGRCTCVCKSWYGLIKSPNFITTYCNRRVLNDHDDSGDSDLLVVYRYSEDGKERLWSLHRDNETFDEHARLEFHSKSLDDKCLKVIGSCNGLFCLSHGKTLFLWNPTIRKLVALPPYCDGFGSHRFSIATGFGFDPRTDDYKVIRIVYPGLGQPQHIYIYSLNTRTWRNISNLALPCYIPKQSIPKQSSCAYFYGSAHWVASHNDEGDGYKSILSFSMTDEVFSKIKLPDSIARPHWTSDLEVVNSRESLYVLENNSSIHSNPQSYCVWVMTKYGVAESWTKLVNIREFVPKWFAGFRKNGDLLLTTRRGGLLHVDLKAKKWKLLETRGSPESQSKSLFYCDSYKESIGLLGVSSFIYGQAKRLSICMEEFA